MGHDYDQKHRHAPARDLSYRCWHRYFDGLGIGIITGVLALLAGIFILIGR
jgi:hypothetical protein